MSRQAYPQYKPSGIEWLGEIPEHWGIRRLKYTAGLINVKLDGADTDLPYTGLEHIESWTGKRLALNGDATSEGQANLYQRGDVLFGKLRPYLAKAHAADSDGICTGELLVLRPKEVDQKFLLDYMLNPAFVAIVDSSTYGAKMPRSNWDFIGNLPALIPPQEEQRAIAAFLDRETARIDALIEKKRRQIELLQEKRSALISSMISGQLSIIKDAETGKIRTARDEEVRQMSMNNDQRSLIIVDCSSKKDSGIEWLGKIPKHWEVVPLRWYIRIASGDFLPNTSLEVVQSDGYSVPALGGNGLMGYTDNANVYDSCIVIGRVGAQCGNIHLVNSPSWVTDNALIIYIINGFDVSFLGAVLDAANLNRLANQNAQPLITGSMVKALLVSRPPQKEQRAIVEFTDRETARIDAVIEKVEKSIEMLREHRTALISAAVTGKIDVREEMQA